MCDKVDLITSSDSNDGGVSSPLDVSVAESDKGPCPIRSYNNLESVHTTPITEAKSFYSVPRGHKYQRGSERCCFRIL